MILGFPASEQFYNAFAALATLTDADSESGGCVVLMLLCTWRCTYWVCGTCILSIFSGTLTLGMSGGAGYKKCPRLRFSWPSRIYWRWSQLAYTQLLTYSRYGTFSCRRPLRDRMRRCRQSLWPCRITKAGLCPNCQLHYSSPSTRRCNTF